MGGAQSTKHAKKGLRWWPAGAVLVLVAGAVLWIRGHADLSFQERNLQTLGVLFGAILILLLWWLTASRTRWRARVYVAAGLLSAVSIMAGLFHIRGVTVDFLPILDLRWSRRSAPSLLSHPEITIQAPPEFQDRQ